MTKIVFCVAILAASCFTKASQSEAAQSFAEKYGFEVDQLYAEELVVPYEDVLKLCEKGVRDLSAVSETIDRVGAGADMRIQLQFSSLLKETNDCAHELSERSQSGKKYSVSKDWFGNGYSLSD